MDYIQIEMYTYDIDGVITYLNSLYSNLEKFTYKDLQDDNKYLVEHPYSQGFDMNIIYYSGYGKVIFEMHLVE